ncbi:hypothetical protein IKI14_03950 [bacterium]|nr:hypothetical protein [bacterium]
MVAVATASISISFKFFHLAYNVIFPVIEVLKSNPVIDSPVRYRYKNLYHSFSSGVGIVSLRTSHEVTFHETISNPSDMKLIVKV